MKTQMQLLKEATEELDHKEMDRRYHMLKRKNDARQVCPTHMWCDNCGGAGGWYETSRYRWIKCGCKDLED